MFLFDPVFASEQVKKLIKVGFIPFNHPSAISQLNLTTLGSECICLLFSLDI